MKRGFKGILLSGSCATALAALLLPAAAANAQTSAQANAANSQTLSEVVVTAERRTSTAQRTAASISVRTGDDLLQQGKFQLSSIIEDVPGITGGAKDNAGNAGVPGSDNPAGGLIIRGVPSNAPAGGAITSTASAAALYVDDVYNGLGGSYDIDRVEVLRGPQGTLYGRSATSGVVAIHTRNPNLTTFNGDISAEFGSADLRHVSAGVEAPIIEDKLGVRISGDRYERDGFDSPKGGRRTSSAGRIKVLVKPTDNFTVLLGAAMDKNELFTGGLNMAQYPLGVYTYTPIAVQKVETQSTQYWTNMNLDLGPVGVTYIGAYRSYKADGGSFFGDLSQTVRTTPDDFWTHEIRFRSQNESSLQWQAGLLSYSNDLYDANLIETAVGRVLRSRSRSHKETTAIGGFAEATWTVVPTTRITAGIRYDTTEVQNTQSYTGANLVTVTLSGAAGRREFQNTTYKLRVEHDLTPQNMIYASTATGFSPGDVALATNGGGNPVVTAFDAKTLYAYEAGSKNRFFDNRLEVNGAVFYSDYGGYQTAVNIGTSTSAIYRSVVTPITSYGLEFEAVGRVWQGGRLGFNASYMNARFHDIEPEFATYFARSQVLRVIPLQASVSLDHTIQVADEISLALHGDVRYHGRYDAQRISVAQLNNGALPYVQNGPATFANLSATVTFKDRYSLTGYVRNVTDKRELTGLFTINSAVNGVIVSSGTQLTDPRTFGLVAKAKF